MGETIRGTGLMKAMTAVADVHQAPPGVGDTHAVAPAMLHWYDRARRDLPWRVPPGRRAEPYRVWLSEVMLQQTTVKAVIPYYEAFLKLWPRVTDLAAADRDDVMRAWAGLGYYSRARNLHDCAKAVVEQHGGRFPESEEELLRLPGIGRYTAAAIASIAFGQRAMPVDGNIERVVARLHAVETPLPEAKTELRDLAGALMPRTRVGDFAQGMMDLGATVCTPRRPSCMICPLEDICRARSLGRAAELPHRSPKAERPKRHGIAFFALAEDGRVLLRKRPDEGLLAGMLEVPSTEWSEDWLGADEALRTAPIRADWWAVPGSVTHTFTHFKLELFVYRALVPATVPLTLWARQERCTWVHRRDLAHEALPSVMRKVIAHGLTSKE